MTITESYLNMHFELKYDLGQHESGVYEAPFQYAVYYLAADACLQRAAELPADDAEISDKDRYDAKLQIIGLHELAEWLRDIGYEERQEILND